MKNLKYIIVLLIAFILTGCANITSNMEIKDDKSMSLNIEILFNEDTRKLMKDTISYKKNELIKNGYEITEKADQFYEGYIINKTFDNINDLSNNTGKEVIITDFTTKDFDETKLFTIKKGLFYNTYTANFVFDSLYDIYDNNYKNDNNTTLREEIKVSTYSFSVTLPRKPIMSNSENISNNGTTLTWNLSNEENSTVKFSFKLKNKLNTIIFIILISLIILGLSYYFISKIIKKKKKISSKPIYRGYDESIKDEVENNIKYHNNIGKVASAVINKPIKKEEKKEEKKVVEEEKVIIPETAEVKSNNETLNNYEINFKEEEMVRRVAKESSNIKRDPIYVKQTKDTFDFIELEESSNKIDMPDIEELK